MAIETSDFEELCELIEQVPLDVVTMPPVPSVAKVWGIGYHAVTMDGALDYLEQVIRARQNAYAITSNHELFPCFAIAHPRLMAFYGRGSLGLVRWNSGPVGAANSVRRNSRKRVTGSDLIYRLCERCAR